MRLQVYEQMEPPAEMLMSLLPFQKEFLAWAISQERGEIRGGILADEMGMGKTIQVLFLCHARHAFAGVLQRHSQVLASVAFGVLGDDSKL